MADEGSGGPHGGGARSPLEDLVVVTNRGPLSFHLDGDGTPVLGHTAGGLAGSLRPLVQGRGARWVASVLSEADRRAVAAGLTAVDGLTVELVDPDPEIYRLAYDVVSNATLWFCHHHLFDAARQPRSDARWAGAWDAYREYNRIVADRVADVAPEGGRVLVQDYHLCLLGARLAERRPDLRTVHFSHTPFADPSVLGMLPDDVSAELLAGLAGFGACGFHAARWEAGYLACQAELGRPATGGGLHPTFVSALTADPAGRATEAARPEVARAREALDRAIGGGDRQVIVRVDRMELSKNLLRGFWAFDELLARHGRWRGSVVFVALAYPSRQGLHEYRAYQDEVEAAVADINGRWATPDWTPIVLHVGDDYPRSLAALTRYDVLLVNPVRDGLNLVAKEGPLANTTDGVLALSRQAGAYAELAPAALALNPFDVGGTASVLHQALSLPAAERAALAAELRALVTARRPEDWLDDLLTAAR